MGEKFVDTQLERAIEHLQSQLADEEPTGDQPAEEQPDGDQEAEPAADAADDEAAAPLPLPFRSTSTAA